MSISNIIKIFFLLIILSIEIGQSLIPVERYGQRSILVDNKVLFFGGGYPINTIDYSIFNITYQSAKK